MQDRKTLKACKVPSQLRPLASEKFRRFSFTLQPVDQPNWPTVASRERRASTSVAKEESRKERVASAALTRPRRRQGFPPTGSAA
eukprot:48226-Pleurochrysis_carterae.AAC.1